MVGANENIPGMPKKKLERIAGIMGAIFIMVEVGIKLLDWISRAQTVMTLNPLLPYLATPYGVGGALIVGFILVIWATRLEQTREENDAPRIITDFNSRKPSPIRRHWFWAKLTGILVVLSLIVVFVSIWIEPKRSSHATRVASGPGQVHAFQGNSTPAPPQQVPSELKPKNSKPLSTRKTATNPPTSTANPPFTAGINQTNQPRNEAPIPASDPLACPATGTLATGWIISLDQMTSSGPGLPIEGGPIRLTGSMDEKKLHPALQGKFGSEVTPPKGSRYVSAKAFLDDLKSHLGAAAPRAFRPNEKLNRYVSKVERNFQNLQQLTVTYEDGAFGESEVIQSGSVLVPLTALNSASQSFVTKQDTEAKEGADKGCKGYLKYLAGED
jgi:hypothetical protein